MNYSNDAEGFLAKLLREKTRGKQASIEIVEDNARVQRLSKRRSRSLDRLSPSQHRTKHVTSRWNSTPSDEDLTTYERRSTDSNPLSLPRRRPSDPKSMDKLSKTSTAPRRNYRNQEFTLPSPDKLQRQYRSGRTSPDLFRSFQLPVSNEQRLSVYDSIARAASESSDGSGSSSHSYERLDELTTKALQISESSPRPPQRRPSITRKSSPYSVTTPLYLADHASI